MDAESLDPHLELRLDAIEAKLDAILAHLQCTSDGVSRMNGHIDFVEGVYDTLRHPLSRLTGFVRRKELPEPPARTATEVSPEVSSDDNSTP